jgi:UDP-glucuronate 4-epimerase
MIQNKIILITGGAGFIGSHLVDYYLADSKYSKVICIDNLTLPTESSDKKENIKHNLKNPKLIFYKEDIKNTKKIEEIFQKEKPNVVVHVAAIADTRNAVLEPQKYIDTNITGTLNLLESSKNLGVDKFIFFSSSSVYGNKNKAPFTEVMQADFAISPYGATKKAGEVLTHTYTHNFKLPVAVLRVFNAYGPRMRPGLVLYKWVKAILAGESIEMSGKGLRKRDYTYVGDIVTAVEKSINKKIDYQVLNIGNSNPLSLKELLKITEKVLSLKAVVVSRESHKSSVELTHADTSKAKKIINWQPKTSFETGIHNFVEWYKQNRL